MTTPTPEQFLAQPSDPDEDHDTEALSPLDSIAHSLQLIAQALIQDGIDRTGARAEVSEADELRQALDQADAEHAALLVKLNEVAAIVKPSTSKLANAVRAVLDPTPADTEPVVQDPAAAAAPDPTADIERVPVAKDPAPLPIPRAPEPQALTQAQLEQPADDASIEIWRLWASRVHGLEGAEQMNRSQIRTALGIAQPVPAS